VTDPVNRKSGAIALAGDDGLIFGLAFDHRDSLDAMLKELARSLNRPAIQGLKAAVVREIAPLATTVMIDNDYGRVAIADRAAGARAALVMPLEAQGYAQRGDERATTLLADFSAPDARDAGAVACKLLLPLRPDRAGFVATQLDIARAACAATHRAGLAFVIEPQVYRLSTEFPAEFRAAFTDLAIAATERVASVGADLLKLPFPTLDERGSPGADERAAAACTRLHVAATDVPWVLYGAGVEADVFAWQLRHAGAAGAAGFLVGRTVWREALRSDDPVAIARDVCRPRFESFVRIARTACRPLSG
jgi:tagatose 1,6-diphosphate aldolase